MNEQSPSVAQSFTEHVRAFHQGLPAEQQRLLEQVFALATLAASDEHDTKGNLSLNFAKIEFKGSEAGPIDVLSALGLQSAGTKGFSWGMSNASS